MEVAPFSVGLGLWGLERRGGGRDRKRNVYTRDLEVLLKSHRAVEGTSVLLLTVPERLSISRKYGEKRRRMFPKAFINLSFIFVSCFNLVLVVCRGGTWLFHRKLFRTSFL